MLSSKMQKFNEAKMYIVKVNEHKLVGFWVVCRCFVDSPESSFVI